MATTTLASLTCLPWSLSLQIERPPVQHDFNLFKFSGLTSIFLGLVSSTTVFLISPWQPVKNGPSDSREGVELIMDKAAG